MNKELLNISGKIDAASVALYGAIAEEMENHSVGYLVVGATARDLVLHYAYGVEIQRATNRFNSLKEIAYGAFFLKAILAATVHLEIS